MRSRLRRIDRIKENAIEVLDHAYRIGDVSLSIGKHPDAVSPPSEVNEHDLVFHLRLGDRLLHRGSYAPDSKLDFCKLSAAIARFAAPNVPTVG